jgi:hypothetical protein
MPIYDYRCPKCGEEKIDVYAKYEDVRLCDKCKEQMVKNCNCSHFKLVYNNKTDMCSWQGESSQYWMEYKKQKAEGKNVKPYGED